VIPRNATKVDWEVELALVVGKAALYVPTNEALDYVAGYACTTTILNAVFSSSPEVSG
jgi:2-keto-4-pentenoate hydratase/2-oxohepta-3-ene-1,7-dioic acid hydratase in catechol pathway